MDSRAIAMRASRLLRREALSDLLTSTAATLCRLRYAPMWDSWLRITRPAHGANSPKITASRSPSP